MSLSTDYCSKLKISKTKNPDPPNPTNDDDDEFFDAFDDFPFYDCNCNDQSHPSTSDSNEIPASTLRRRSLSRRRTEVDDSKTSFGERSYKIYRKLIENEIDLERKSESSTDRADSAPPESVENEESTVTTENDVRVGDSVESVDSLGVLFFSYMIIVDPFRTIKRGREFLLLKLYNLCKLNCGFVSPLVSGLLKEHESVWKLVFRIGWGLFWGIYVGFILISGLFIRYFVEEPIQIKETLNFDYEENSPVALIPLMSSYGASCGFNCEENKESRVVPIGHKLQVTVILTLPESEYNRNLGFFSRMRGFMEANVPTSCIKVKIEQRAELWLGAGIPQIYDTSLILESELPLFKRIIWPVILPKARPRDGSARKLLFRLVSHCKVS
ncbi:hypothetical protein LWI28_023171 [Acer negundo]|uniref:Seipin n=1 Tax=Acer negundo TaxID=4023 RepID=A0AAD5P5T5_ACENE|nr:hypothetical protein LWI28_023171 [Acer negundo]